MSSLPESIICARLGQTVFNKDELDAMSAGTFLYGDSPQLPSRTGMGWRLFTMVTVINRNHETGGSLLAEGGVDPRHLIFTDHFPNLKVLPGLYLQDQLLQLVGLLVGLHGLRGQGFALGSGSGRFKTPVTPDAGKVTFNVIGKRLRRSAKQTILTADGSWEIGGKIGGTVTDMIVGVIHA